MAVPYRHSGSFSGACVEFSQPPADMGAYESSGELDCSRLLPRRPSCLDLGGAERVPLRDADLGAPRSLSTALRAQHSLLVAARGLLKSPSCHPSLFRGWSPTTWASSSDESDCSSVHHQIATDALPGVSIGACVPTCQMGRACARSDRGGHRASLRLASTLCTRQCLATRICRRTV